MSTCVIYTTDNDDKRLGELAAPLLSARFMHNTIGILCCRRKIDIAELYVDRLRIFMMKFKKYRLKRTMRIPYCTIFVII
jgi:hypothetical protein